MATCQICKYAGMPKDKSPCSECKGYSKYEYEKPQTNADRIRSMSDESLMQYLYALANKDFELTFCQNKPECLGAGGYGRGRPGGALPGVPVGVFAEACGGTKQ